MDRKPANNHRPLLINLGTISSHAVGLAYGGYQMLQCTFVATFPDKRSRNIG
jgi:hypothetical protein